MTGNPAMSESREKAGDHGQRSAGAVTTGDPRAEIDAGKHTKGPWRACQNGECSCKVVSSEKHPIANVVSGKWGDDFPAIRLVGDSSLNMKAEAYMEQFTYGEIYPAVAAANARLIAAAPDLLEAVEELLATHPAAYRDPGAIDNRTDNAVRIARLALSRAREGGQP
jgi:hypothetical protein